MTGPQLMAEIGDVRRFTHKGALVAFAGVDAPPFQSGEFEAKSRHVSKRGSSALRRTLFQICCMFLCRAGPEDPSSVSWTKSDPKESISMFIRLPVLQRFCAFIMLE